MYYSTLLFMFLIVSSLYSPLIAQEAITSADSGKIRLCVWDSTYEPELFLKVTEDTTEEELKAFFGNNLLNKNGLYCRVRFSVARKMPLQKDLPFEQLRPLLDKVSTFNKMQYVVPLPSIHSKYCAIERHLREIVNHHLHDDGHIKKRYRKEEYFLSIRPGILFLEVENQFVENPDSIISLENELAKTINGIVVGNTNGLMTVRFPEQVSFKDAEAVVSKIEGVLEVRPETCEEVNLKSTYNDKYYE